VVEVQLKQITAVNAAVAMGKLLQVSGGWLYTGDGKGGSVALDCKPRTDMLLELIEQAERKVLVFVPFRHAISGISKVLDEAKIEHAVVHGQVSGRDEIFNRFQNTDKYKVLLAHPQCLAHGLTLTAADCVIWYMPITSLEIYEQANARITRVGQKHRQMILHLQSTAVEKKIYSMLRGKQKIQDALLTMLADATGRQLAA
jgi:SNF2 family DNA or RNA helicase